MTLRSISGFEPLRTLAASIKKYVTVYCQMSPQLGRNYELLLTLMLQMCQLLSLCASSIMSPVHWIRLEVIGTPLAVVTIWQVTEGVLGWSCLSGKGEAAVRTTLQTKALWMSSMCCFNVREELGIFLHKLHWNIFSSACPTTWDLICLRVAYFSPQSPQVNRFPAWVNRCCRRSCYIAKHLWHTSHLKDLLRLEPCKRT